MLSGPRRAQVREQVAYRIGPRPELSAQADEGPCGDVASHFVGHLVFMGVRRIVGGAGDCAEATSNRICPLIGFQDRRGL